MSVQRFRAGEYVEVPIRDPQGKWVRYSDYEDLQSRLAQVEKELTEEKRLRSDLKQIAQAGFSDISALGSTLKENAVIDFRSRAVQICKDKATEFAPLGIAAKACNEIAEALENLDHKGE